MITEIIRRNNLHTGDIIGVLFTATGDLTACYPAEAAREMGLTEAALMCAQEMGVDGSLPMCLRASVLADVSGEIRHAYLGGAASLRPDIDQEPI